MSSPERAHVIEEYENHLLTTCGVTKGTLDLFRWHVSKFLVARFGHPSRTDLQSLCPGDLIKYISDLTPRYSQNTRKSAVTALRSFLRWLRLTGRCSSQLINAVPTVSATRLSGLPMHLSQIQLRTFLNSIDRRRPNGLRRYAAALCMARLGLRVSEVVRLSLEDIDWRQGVLRIDKGKGRRTNTLPLPRDVGRAIIAYLRRGRPASSSRYVFLGKYASLGLPAHKSLFRTDIRRAFESSGLNVPSKGTRVLRHTAATHMLQKGATLKEIADVLGHRSIDTTAIYAKVDLPTLREVAMPWPEVAP